MKKDSILFAITVTFIVSIILIVVSFFVLYMGNQKKERMSSVQKNMYITKIFLGQFRHIGLSKELENNLKELSFSIISDKKEQIELLADKNFLHVVSREMRRIKITQFKIQDYYYVHVETPRGKFILKNDAKSETHQGTIVSIFFIVLLSFIFLYITTIKKLKPLKNLKDKVEHFGDENFDIECSTDNKDEISLLANEFDKSAKKLKKLKESRNIFIRNIMHELKTPITKGKFLTQLPQTEENSEKMQKVFYRLESLINEFASIEELMSSKNELDKKDYYLEDIVDNAVDILMCDENQAIKEFDNIKLHVDFKLFSLAIKNLLDNGIKYSIDKKIKIRTQDGKLFFESVGKRLKYPLSSYYEPFFKGSDVKSNQSFGLGLYIVKNILDANGFTLRYEYNDGINRFIV